MYYQLPLRHVLDLNFTCLLATFKISGIVTAICNKRHHCNWQLLTVAAVALHWVHVSNHQERCQQSVESPKSEQSARHLGGISTPPSVLGGIRTLVPQYWGHQKLSTPVLHQYSNHLLWLQPIYSPPANNADVTKSRANSKLSQHQKLSHWRPCE